MMRLHRRQFVVGPAPFRAYEDWHCQPMGPSVWLSYCPALRVFRSQDTDGNEWTVLGLAIATLEADPQPSAQIARVSSSQVPDLYPSWAGRWVLVGNGQIHMDASGLLGCFYGRDTDGQLWASSSPALLAQILFPDQPPIPDPRVLQYEVGISWFTPPRSRLTGIQRLLPSQILDLNDQAVRPRPLMPTIECDRPPEKAIALISQSLLITIKNLAEVSETLWLGLTAGYDSRLMLALSHQAGIPLKPFTRISARTAVADRLLPPKLAHACGYPHITMGQRQSFPERRQFVLEHNANHVSDGDADPFINGLRDGMEGISFGGHGFAVASGFAKLRQLPDTFKDAEVGAKQIANLFGEPTDSSATAGLQEWLEWIQDHPHANLDWRDRFFIEQRQAGWLSAKEQLYDLTLLERFPILNAARNYAILLGVPEAKRLDSVIQADIIGQIAPFLLAYPFNPKDSELGLRQIIQGAGPDAPVYLFKKVMRKLRG
ncbi:MAG: hypothetical protein ACFBSF_00655 [Leptolyngbyaceae cyanobacterium]